MESYNNPYIDRLIGISPEQKELEKRYHEYIIAHIEKIGGEKIEDFEIEKTEKDVSLIQFVELAIDEMLRYYGRTKRIGIPLANIHILKMDGTKDFTKGRLIDGAHSSSQQSILVDRKPSDIQFSVSLFHELLHVKCFTAFQVIADDKSNETGTKVSSYRQGMSVVSRDGKTIYLKSVEEAVIAYLTADFYKSITKEPLFKNEMDAVNNGSIAIDTGRQNELSQLHAAVSVIYERNKHLFPDSDAVLRLFIDSQVNGNLLELGKLIENTFGPGTLKKIDPESIS